ncbi:MAG: FumA C-terminus/TtdB family hydratase beta subunit [Candidatus Altiarchaeota archaeon]|nr:FumA C-terminus/TtdB family hydratase beta subunit [Candidatus Altiarchaeota archaeon]
MIHLKTPLERGDIEHLATGEFIYLSGTVVTGRDRALKRALEEKNFPVDMEGGVLFHSGPIAKKSSDGWDIVAIGPTTSSRLNFMQKDFMDGFGVKAVIGKGGMNPEIFRGRGVYLAMTGGCAALGARSVKEVREVHWLDLGMGEAVWVLEVEKLGPLLVGIDYEGNSLYHP